MSIPMFNAANFLESIPIFNGTNFVEWSDHVHLHLGLRDLDLALLTDKPAALTDTSNEDDKALHKTWDRSNRLCMLFMRVSMADNIKTSLPEIENAKDLLKYLDERFNFVNPQLVGPFLKRICNMKYDGVSGMNDHILEMTNLAAKLKTLGLNMGEPFLVELIVNSLPSQYGPFHICYNSAKDKWNLIQLAQLAIQEETRLKQRELEDVHCTSQGNTKKRRKPKKSRSQGSSTANDFGVQGSQIQKKNCRKCFFGKKSCAIDCLKHQTWFEETKGMINDPNCSSQLNVAYGESQSSSS